MTERHMPAATRDRTASPSARTLADNVAFLLSGHLDVVGRRLASAIALGLLATLPLGRLALAAETRGDSTPWAVTMADDVAVELVGVSRCPSEGEPWWRPDGSRLDEAPYAKIALHRPPRANLVADAFEFAIRLRNVPKAFPGVSADALPSLKRPWESTSSAKAVAANDVTVVAALIPQTHDTCTVWVRMPSGKWVTVASADGRRDTTVDTPHGQVVFREAQPGGVVTFSVRSRGAGAKSRGRPEVTRTTQGIAIAVATVHAWKAAHRVVAIDRRGKTQLARMSFVNRTDSAREIPSHFPTLGIDDVAEFRLQGCPFKWIVFRNVALRPGRETEVQVIKTDHDPKELLREIMWQTQSAERVPMLCCLGMDRGQVRRYWSPTGKPVDSEKIRHVIEEVAPAPKLGSSSDIPTLQLWFRYDGQQKDLDHFRVRPTLCARNRRPIPTDVVAADLKRDPATGHRWAACSLRPQTPSKWDKVGGLEQITFPIGDWQTFKVIEQFGGKPQQIHAVIKWSCGTEAEGGRTVFELLFQCWKVYALGGQWRAAGVDAETVSGRDVLHMLRPPLKSVWQKPLRHELFRQIVIDKKGRNITQQALSRVTAKTHRGIHHQEYFDMDLSDIARVQIQTRRLASLPMHDADQRPTPDLATLLKN